MNLLLVNYYIALVIGFVDDGGELYSHHYLLRTSSQSELVNSPVLCILVIGLSAARALYI